ncbi:MAG: carboxypeptidase-like regulatory domain-containing protein [Prevotella sp.]|nr:carboxypeptidase-like regulatory domain-containing protein [Prevotella sp.]
MKKTVLTLLFVGAAAMTMAQSTKTVKGAVIDLNGNPLPGAKVEATGGAESTVTDADGTFSLEVSQWLKSLSVTYPGMNKKKMSIKSDNRDLIFTMTEEKSSHWFVNAVAQCDDDCLGAGVMFGQLNKWGWYGKTVMDYSCLDDYYYDVSYGSTISVGVIKRVSKSFYMYLGGGYTNYYRENDRYDLENHAAALLEIGALHRIGHFNLNYGVGITSKTIDFSEIKGAKFYLGVGYSF